MSALPLGWLRTRREAVAQNPDPLVREALEVAPWDAAFIGAKLNRALLGRDHYQSSDDDDDHPVQNDWNGSARVALISIVRFEPAWRLIACVTGESMPREFADVLVHLKRMTHAESPKAISFIRPGFDTA